MVQNGLTTPFQTFPATFRVGLQCSAGPARSTLETLAPRVRVPDDIARRARSAIDRMLELA
jgi:hypothetical protein